MSSPDDDARYQAKLAARAAGAKAVVFHNPAPSFAAANISAEDARFRAKLAARASGQSTSSASSEPAAKADEPDSAPANQKPNKR